MEKNGLVKLEPLLKNGDKYYVAISHAELDSLVGRLLQMCDLTGDSEQRMALKNEVKFRCRDWLNDHYALAGYSNTDVPTDNVVEIG